MFEYYEESPGIIEKVTFLKRPEAYATHPQRVEAIETHLAWVFLTDKHVYKLKKPVRSIYLDFSTPEARRWDCMEEVRLNRRLAANVYCGVLPLTSSPRGTIQLAGEGDIIDWLVKMRRLPADRMLDRAIAQGTVHANDVRNVGLLLANFYKEASPVACTASRYRQLLTEGIQTAHQELATALEVFPAALVESACTAQLAFLNREAEMFDSRMQAGKMIEAHGDLRPEHTCLEPAPVIIDWLEFNRQLRLLDPVSELAFLALECERLGAASIGEQLLAIYHQETGDQPPESLRQFYSSYHAYTRARIALWHLKEDHVRTPDRWRTKARHYLRLAVRSTTLMGY